MPAEAGGGEGQKEERKGRKTVGGQVEREEKADPPTAWLLKVSKMWKKSSELVALPFFIQILQIYC